MNRLSLTIASSNLIVLTPLTSNTVGITPLKKFFSIVASFEVFDHLTLLLPVINLLS